MTPVDILIAGLVALVVVAIVLLVRQSAELRAPRPADPLFQLLEQRVDSVQSELRDALSRLGSDVNQQLSGLKESVAQRLAENVQTVQASGQQVGEGLGQALRAVSEVRQQLGQLHEASARIREVGQNISTLKEILQAPQFRGGLGEFLLEELLAQLFPRGFYSMQFTYANGDRVDAVLRLGNGLIPIDSKFPLDSFRRVLDARARGAESDARQELRKFRADVRKHIDEVARKYIRPNENIYDFALMYIPAENVYYESVIREDLGSNEKGLLEYALVQRVIPVSPNTLFAYLQVIALGLKGMKVEESAKTIVAGLGQLQRDLATLEESFEKTGRQLQFAQTNYTEAQKVLAEFAQHLALLTELPGESEPPPSLSAAPRPAKSAV